MLTLAAEKHYFHCQWRILDNIEGHMNLASTEERTYQSNRRQDIIKPYTAPTVPSEEAEEDDSGAKHPDHGEADECAPGRARHRNILSVHDENDDGHDLMIRQREELDDGYTSTSEAQREGPEKMEPILKHAPSGIALSLKRQRFAVGFPHGKDFLGHRDYIQTPMG